MTTNEGMLAREMLKPGPDLKVCADQPARAISPRKKSQGAASILYMLTPQRRLSPFDVNMAVDAGYKIITPYDDVSLAEVKGLVHDAIFSRPSEHCPRTGLFIGGNDVILALDMMAAAKAAMFPPFEVSLFADPGGSFTAAAAMVACVERTLKRNYKRSLRNLRVSVFGATGVVGFASSVLAALDGAQVRMVAHESLEPLKRSSAMALDRFGARLEPVAGYTEAAKAKIIRDSDVVFSAGPAGIQIISRKQIARADNLLVVADLNAVAPTGVEGMEAYMDGAPLPGSSALGVGPLAIGDIKYKTQAGLFKRMLKADRPLHLDFRDAFELARTLTAQRARGNKSALS